MAQHHLVPHCAVDWVQQSWRGSLAGNKCKQIERMSVELENMPVISKSKCLPLNISVTIAGPGNLWWFSRQVELGLTC